jgi:hypothetical protein
MSRVPGEVEQPARIGPEYAEGDRVYWVEEAQPGGRETVLRWRSVGKPEFFGSIGRMNVMPRSERHVTYWELPDRTVVGKSTPGYMAEGPQAYFVREPKE